MSFDVDRKAGRALLEKIADTAETMRDVQRAYFKSRRPEVLRQSKNLERELDKLLDMRRQRSLL